MEDDQARMTDERENLFKALASREQQLQEAVRLQSCREMLATEYPWKTRL